MKIDLRVVVLVILVIGMAFAGCTCADARGTCARDGDCADDEICYLDDMCAPRTVAEGRGVVLGTECTVMGGREFGCAPDELCRMRFCLPLVPPDDADVPMDASIDGTLPVDDMSVAPDEGDASMSDAGCTQVGAPGDEVPLFGGVQEATGDGPDAVALSWFPAADETTPAGIEYLVYVSTTSGVFDFTMPTTVVVGMTTGRVAGLTTDTPYFFVVRARDAAAQIDCNTRELSATPTAPSTCVDFATEVQTIFNSRCVSCHSGATPPRDLMLDTFAGVMAGGLTGFEVTACQPDSSLIYLKIASDSPPVGMRMPFGGPYLTATQIDTIGRWIAQGASPTCPADPTLCGDTMAPTFAGLETAALENPTGARLCWNAATDDTTPTESLAYDVYQATTDGGEVLTGLPTVTSPPGASCVSVTGLAPDSRYCWIVRARDEAGNRDANTVEQCIDVPAASCIDFTTVVQPILTANCVRCHSGATAPRGLELDSLAGLLAGGATGNEVSACDAPSSLLFLKIALTTPPIGIRMPADGPPYLSTAQISAIEQWIDEGARASCAAPDPCSDVTPPTFGGLTSAVLEGSNGSQLCWSPATDAGTPAGAMVYDVYQANAPGAELLSGLPTTTSPGGAMCLSLTGLTPGSRYCWVVRARDRGGNRDSNTVERCIDVPTASCIDYASVVQPIFTSNCVRCHSGPAAPRGLQLDSLAGVLAGGMTGSEVTACNSTSSLLYLKVALGSPPVGLRMPADGPPYLSSAQINVIQQWIDEGARDSCATPDPCTDVTPPTFAGLTSAALEGTNGSRICWAPATDAGTPSGSMLYDVYQATTSGGEALAGLPTTTSAAGASCMSLTGLTPGSRYCWVVRARDAAGNRDGNIVEQCLDVPAASCIDYTSVIQPIFNNNCVRCHSGAAPPRGLRLDSLAGVRAGGLTGNEVTACNAASSLLYLKVALDSPPVGTRMPADGPPYLSSAQIGVIQQWINEGARSSCAAPDPCTDVLPPTFGGLTTAVLEGANGSRLCWSPAMDTGTPAAAILYDVYQATTPGTELLGGLPTVTSPAGASCMSLTGLTPGSQYCWIVRARDGAGNSDANTVERCVTLPTAACIDYTTVVQPIFNNNCVRCHSGAGAPRGLRLDSLAGALAGGLTGNEVVACNSASSLLYLKIALATPPIGGRMPADGPPYLSAPQITVIQQWINEGARSSCTVADPCTDILPPTFGGITTATLQGANGSQLCWSPATDAGTPAANILYDVYQATAPGAELFTGLPTTTSPAGATCMSLAGLTPGSQYCWVVRARDGAGNRDGNTVERCIIVPAASCIDYTSVIQPIFSDNCIRCHSGGAAPRGLHLDSLAGVLAGGLTGSEVTACNAVSSLLYLKISSATPPVGVRMPADGPPYLSTAQISVVQQWINEGARSSCAAPDPCTDVTPPTFAGLATATLQGANGSRLCWSAATDGGTPPGSMLYDVYQATTPGAELLSGLPSTTSAAGATCMSLTGLTPGAQYCWVVRARDGAGNRDGNTVERCITVPAASCIDYSTVIQPIFNDNCVRCHSGATPPRNLRLDTLAGVLAGGLTGSEVTACNAASSLLYLKVSLDTPPIGARMPADGPPYLAPAQISVIQQWINEGARSSCSVADPCTDVTPPTFAGLTTAVLEGANGSRLCWSAATDAGTPAASMLYDVYQATMPGGELLAGLPTTTGAAGATCMSLTGLTPGSQYCWVVRARDAAGNRDGNMVERCVTVPAASCIDYATVVQPIFNDNCVRCHRGATPPRGLRLDTLAGVLIGGATGSEVTACNSASSLLYLKISLATPPIGVRMPADGPPYLSTAQISVIQQWINEGARSSCAAPDPCTDIVPPVFAGLATATLQGANGSQLCWSAATDAWTPAASMLYDVYQANTPGGELLGGLPSMTSPAGATCMSLTGLTPGSQYCWIVRARDGAGNRDGNVVERCITVPAAACIDYASVIQPIFNNNCTRCHSGATPPRNLRLDTLAGALAGGLTGNEVTACNAASSLLYLKVALATPPVGVRMPADGPPYLTTAQIGVMQQWIDEGARASCSVADPCTDVTPPTFAGLSGAALEFANGARLCWSAATDAGTPAASMLYDVYQATTVGGEVLTGLPTTTSPAGATCMSLTGLTPGSQYCWVVRARDAAGNRDGNTVERCITVPAAACIDYSSVIQPILNANCVRCHSGATPPRNLRLDTLTGVLAGGLSGNEVTACNSASSLLYLKVSLTTPPIGARMPADGPPYLSTAQLAVIQQWIDEGARSSCSVADPCTDVTPPTFAGLATAALQGANGSRLCWSAATDAGTPAASMLYDVYQANTPGGELLTGLPTTTSLAGATCMSLTGLTPGSQYCWVVRARDGAGNRDGNTVERCITVPAAACIDYTSVIQPIFNDNCVRCHSGATPPRNLRLDTLAGVLAGGLTGSEVTACNAASSLLYLKVSLGTPPIGVRMPADGPPYLTAAQISVIQQWINEGARSSCSVADPCTDVTPPTFSGLSTAVLEGANGSRLCWSPAIDAVTPGASMLYDVYQANTPGGELLTGLPTTTSPAGAMCMSLTGLTPGSQYCWVVRARDAAGNRDGNTVERCMTVPAAACIDYTSVIQPIFDNNCTRCHSGPTAPRNLRLDTLAGVLAGGLTGNEVTACNAASSLLYLKISLATPPVGIRMPADGPPYLTAAQMAVIQQWINEGARSSCAVADPCTDVTPPTFAGLSTAVLEGANGSQLCWSPATDAGTPAASMLYDVYQATAPGGEVLTGLPTTTSPAGATCMSLTGLTPGSQYCWVVRARDGAGNRDSNVVERCITVPAASCIDYATVVQPIFTNNCVRCHSGASPPRGLYLDSLAGALAGGLTGNEVVACNSAASLLYLKISLDTPPVGARMPADGPPYLAAAQIAVIQQWINEGARASCAAPDPCSDILPPTFAGLSTAVLQGSNGSQLCWSPGMDAGTPTASLLYDVYQANTPGGELLSGLPTTTSPAGATCMSLTGLTPGSQYCWVVRARDGAGNRDGNTVERCITVPAASCIDYSSVVQPIFDNNCVRCHSGPTAPRGLRLDTLAGVLAGGATGGEVTACSSAASLLYLKISLGTPPIGVRMPADGPPYLSAAQISVIGQWITEGARASCSVPDPCSDTTPPVFGGLTTAVALDATRAQLCWTAATDALTPTPNIVYRVYEGTAPGGEVFTTPRTLTGPGVTCVNITALSPGGNYCWVARAVDGAANEDANLVERCLTMPTLPPGCVDYATMIQPLFDRNCTRCHSGAAPPQWLRLDTYDRVIEGSARRSEVNACSSATSLLISKIGPTPSIGARMPLDGPPYLTTSQIAMVTQWVADGARRICTEASTCGDTTAPTFAGATSATVVDTATVRVCWAPATDARTPAASIRYEVFESATPGGERYTEPAALAVVAGTCVDVPVGPGQRVCFVVRARDLVGTRDTNTREVCATPPAATCGVDYSAVQPILTARCTHCHSNDVSSPRFLDLRSYGGVRAGGSIRNEALACDWAGSLLNTKTAAAVCGRRMPRDGPPWLSPAERSILQAWITSGARQSCTDPNPCTDTTAPTFAGAVSATAVDPTTIDVCWAPATDGATPASGMVYEVFDAPAPGGEDYTRAAPYAYSGGATCGRIRVPAGQRTCFVVRARDLRGNRDTNVVERCVTTVAACFAYSDVVQPVLSARCTQCHSGPSAPRGIRWDTYANSIADSGEVRACRSSNSNLIDFTQRCEMPQDTASGTGSCRACLTSTQIRLFTQWIDTGANNTCPPSTTCP